MGGISININISITSASTSTSTSILIPLLILILEVSADVLLNRGLFFNNSTSAGIRLVRKRKESRWAKMKGQGGRGRRIREGGEGQGERSHAFV